MINGTVERLPITVASIPKAFGNPLQPNSYAAFASTELDGRNRRVSSVSIAHSKFSCFS
jgi:hypothetical protein